MTQLIKSAIEAVEERLSLAGQLKAARKTIETHLDDKLVKIEEQIPRHILQNAQGIIFLSELSACYGYGARIGTGIIIGKLEKSGDLENKGWEWSGPISIKTSSINYGLQYGATLVDHIIILKNRELVANFMEKGSLQIGVDAAFAVGPLGRDAQIGVNLNFDHLSPILSYSVDAKGLYIGVNLEGSIINVRNDCNESFYNASNITASDVLSGKIKPPIDNDDYRRIVELLSEYCDQNRKEVNSEIESAKGQHENQLDHLMDFTKEATDSIMNGLTGDFNTQLKDKVKDLTYDLQDKTQQILDKIENEISTKQAEFTTQGKTENESETKPQNNNNNNVKDTESNQEPKIESQNQSKKKSKKAISEKKAKKNKKTSKNKKKNVKSQSKNIEQNFTTNKESEINLQDNSKKVIESIQKRIGQLEGISKQESPEDERQKIAQAKLKLQQYMDQ